METPGTTKTITKFLQNCLNQNTCISPPLKNSLPFSTSKKREHYESTVERQSSENVDED